MSIAFSDFLFREVNALSSFFMLLVTRGSINRLAKWYACNIRYCNP
uniref:Uncharacterized protein n=1 Tax=Arundo donax TaxID=35708 RepID=A0A0A9GRT7_ARUDO